MIRSSLNSISSLGYDLTLVETLFRLGARPPVVCAVCHVGKKTAIRIYKTIHQRSPKQGMLPYDPYWIVRSSVNNIHAAVFLGLVHDLPQPHSQSVINAEKFITAYELYCRVVSSNPHPSRLEAGVAESILLDINRAGQLNSSEMGLAICEKCHARYVVLNKMPQPFHQCPICDVWADRTGRRRWTTVKTH